MSAPQSSVRKLNVEAITTSIFKRDQELIPFILNEVPKELVKEKMVLAVTSKIVSVAEKRFLSEDQVSDKAALIQREADTYLGEIGYGVHLTIKEGLFIASAGIDQSNSEKNDYLLYPENPYKSAELIWQALKKEWGIKELGIILTDSHTTPLRRGVTGIALAHWGFQAVEDKRGQKDLFGRELKVTTINWADALAVSATAMMGEGDECCPLAVIHGAALRFTENTDPYEVRIPFEEDMYRPFFEVLIK